ncbi:Smr/MutS family protein [Alphaproteobacteria bacterium]|nr:Smr/MutS family protein [Alphaproteobacteria bacterium]
MNNSDDVFLKQMKGVNPIKKNNRIKKEDPKTNYKSEKKNIVKQKKIMLPNVSTVIKNSEFSLEKIDLKKGIKKGSFHIDKKIDFHGKSLIDSEDQFNNTIIESYNSGRRCLLFVTGKGLFKSKNYEESDKPKLYHGIIRSSFVQWAKSQKFSKYILSFEQASIEHGGDGAFYVYLRKNKS